MLGMAWSEIFIIGAVALVVIGPKDLPKVMRTAGQWSRKLRALAGDFQRQFDDMVRQAELDEMRREAEKAMDVDEIKRDVENAVRLDEAGAAAELPVLPSGEVASVRPAEGPLMTETVHEPAHAAGEGAAEIAEPAAPTPVLHQTPETAPETAQETPAHEPTP